MENKKVASSQGLNTTRFLSFRLGEEEYAIPLLKVKEVIAFPEITPIPFSPKHFLGIMNLRGQVISIVDLRTKFAMNKKEVTEESAVIIINLDPVYLGITVDAVNKVLTLSDEEIKNRPELLESSAFESITGVAQKDSKLILLLDIAKALDIEDLALLRQNMEKKIA